LGKMHHVKKKIWEGSLVLLITFNIFNLLNFIFQFAMVRFLDLAEYGVLASLFSMIYILGVFSESIPTVLSKYTTNESNKGKLKNILKKSLKKSIYVSFLFFGLYLLLSVVLSLKLNIPYLLLIITGLMIFFAFFGSVTRGVMQGRKKFFSLGWNLIIESAIKLVLGVSLVLIGWGVYGAMFATVVGAMFAFIVSFIPLRPIIKSKEQKASTPDIYKYTWPVFVLTSVIIIFYSIDVLIARLVFPDILAGQYAVASTIAKIIFVGTFPISKVMFPLSAEKSLDTGHQKKVLVNSLMLILILIGIGLVITALIPEFIIFIFKGYIVKESASVLFLLSIATGLISLSNLFVLYNLSIGRIKGVYLFIFLLVLEALMLYVFSSSIIVFSLAFIAASLILLIASILLIRR